LITGCAWIILCALHRDELLFLQKFISLVIIAGFVENVIYAIDYLQYNMTGNILLGINVIEAIATTVKRTLAFTALMLVVSGYSVFKPSLEFRPKAAIIGLNAAYFVVSVIYQFLDTLKYTPATYYLNIPDASESVFLGLTTILDFVILFWIFITLFTSVTYLKLHNQSHKLQMFKKLLLILVISYGVSLIFFIIELIASWGGLYNSWWRGWFIWDGYWSILHLSLLVVVVAIWRPTENNKLYAYSTQLSDINSVELPSVEPKAKGEETDLSAKDEEPEKEKNSL